MHGPWRRAAIALVGTTLAAAALVPCRAATLGTEAMLQDPTQAAQIEQFWSQVGGTPASFKGQRGLELSYLRFLQSDRAAEKGAIVISSGRTESMLKYKETIHDLWRNGYSVYIHDHRGQGLSQREAATAATPQKGHVERFSDYVDDLRQFVRTEVAAGRHAHLYLVGHSMGGAIAALLLQADAAAQPMFSAAVLSSPMLKIKGVAGLPADILSCRIAREHLAQGGATQYVVKGGGYRPKPFDENQYTGSRVRYQRLIDVYAENPKIQLGSPTVGWFVNACDAAFRARTQGAKVRTPVLLFVAGKDQIVHASGSDEFCANLRKTQAAQGCGGKGGGPIVVDGAEHELFIESDDRRNRVLEQALQFFEANRTR